MRCMHNMLSDISQLKLKIWLLHSSLPFHIQSYKSHCHLICTHRDPISQALHFKWNDSSTKRVYCVCCIFYVHSALTHYVVCISSCPSIVSSAYNACNEYWAALFGSTEGFHFKKGTNRNRLRYLYACGFIIKSTRIFVVWYIFTFSYQLWSCYG